MSERALDLYDILVASRDAPRDKALVVRDKLRELLRAWEDLHDFPHSFQTKTEREREQFYQRQK